MNQPKITQTTITISNLLLRTIIGFNPWEQEEKQDLIITISMDIDPGKAVVSDSVTDTLNYKQVKKSIIALVENSRFNLLETVAYEILKTVLNYKHVLAARIKVDKPHALRFANSVSVEMHMQQISV